MLRAADEAEGSQAKFLNLFEQYIKNLLLKIQNY
jgi:hypothetical protein